MKWIEYSIDTPRLDELFDALAAMDIFEYQIVDERDYNEFSPKEWEIEGEELRDTFSGAHRVVFCVTPEVSESLRPRIEALRSSLEASISLRETRDEDWEDCWKQYYEPVEIGTRLLIQPAWLEPEDAQGRVVYLNEPGMSFGTGTHATTRLCLEMLDEQPPVGLPVLDIGCGSGILAICAMLLGAESALCVDIDKYACNVTESNAALNGITVKTLNADILASSYDLGRYGLICANLVAELALKLMPQAPGLLSDKGSLIVSGILSERAGEIIQAAQSYGLNKEKLSESEGWCAIRLVRA